MCHGLIPLGSSQRLQNRYLLVLCFLQSTQYKNSRVNTGWLGNVHDVTECSEMSTLYYRHSSKRIGLVQSRHLHIIKSTLILR